MQNLIKTALLVGVTSLVSCASIIDGRSQEIVINTNPSGATCTLTRNEMPIGTVTPTPSAVLIEKTKYDIIIKCNKEGYQEATYFNKSGSAGSTFGNIVLGGGIGWAIDSASGADNKYDSPVNITLPVAEIADEEITKKPIHSHKAKVTAQEARPTPKVETASSGGTAEAETGQSVSASAEKADKTE